MESTVPIGCQYVIQAMSTQACRMEMKIFVNDDETLQCNRGSILNIVPEEIENQKCAQYIKVGNTL
jgi:hypothetical protein